MRHGDAGVMGRCQYPTHPESKASQPNACVFVTICWPLGCKGKRGHRKPDKKEDNAPLGTMRGAPIIHPIRTTAFSDLEYTQLHAALPPLPWEKAPGRNLMSSRCPEVWAHRRQPGKEAQSNRSLQKYDPQGSGLHMLSTYFSIPPGCSTAAADAEKFARPTPPLYEPAAWGAAVFGRLRLQACMRDSEICTSVFCSSAFCVLRNCRAAWRQQGREKVKRQKQSNDLLHREECCIKSPPLSERRRWMQS